MSSLPPGPAGNPPTAGRPPAMPPYAPPPRDRSVAFFVAIFLGLLLLVSAALNVVLFVFSIGGLAASGLGSGGMEDAGYQMAAAGGDATARTKVLRIAIHGPIVEAAAPLMGAEGGSVSFVRKALAAAARDDSIRGILLDIDSPGGGVTASDEIHALISRFRRDHPEVKVLALFGDIAASGGYYVAAAAERIIARRTTITGSIGVIMSAYNFGEAARELGISEMVIKSEHTPYKDILSPMRPMTDAERAILTSIVEEMYQQFVTVVDDGRSNLDRPQVQALANGQIYSAGQALQNGLVDELGDQDAALAWFRQALGKEAVALVEFRRLPNLRDLLFGMRAPAPKTAADLAAELLQSATGPRFLYYWPGAR